MTDKISSEDFIKAFGGGVKHNLKRPQGDLISREALKEALANEIKTNDMGMWLKILLVIDKASPVEPDMEFARWVTKMIFDDGVEDFDFEMFSELACRKLEKMGLVEKTESDWRIKGGKE